MNAIAAIARLECMRLLRAPTTLSLLLVLPLLQLILFGHAIRPDEARLTVVVAGPDDRETAEVRRRIGMDAGLFVVGADLPAGAAEQAVRDGRAAIGIELPRRRSFADPLAPLRPVRLVVDAAEPSATDLGTARLEAAYWKAQATRDPAARALSPEIVRLYNPQTRAAYAFLPALVGVAVMIAMVLLGCLSLSREREAGTWETLMALPTGPCAIVLGKLVPHMALGTVQGILVLAGAVLVFDVPVRGPIWAIVLLLPFFAAAHFLTGFALAARARTQVAALQGAVGFYLPALLLSGFLYPFATLPGWAQAIGRLLPLTPFIAAARDVLVRGRGWHVAGQALVPIASFAVAAGLIAVLLQVKRSGRL
ncbi:putative ABC-2 transporter, membrane + ATP binding component [Novosphingobium nitrogenifigens DSM 19370]|uniref:Putative ABC-2 transporter, membrane + ATP binding component n=1 Tax=Novosphingobium nitrogenifigens DSM 19370 TaxID=983920 RepID=F1ZD26_9SPHN|nr:ABC transporter permease [Novosphingobium nitrogenifigens]EGD57487.1 putative ABC-2 transporter, membrane + ATP binding component [Novosphingobium nitrogenifigens DSM 19370]